MLNLDLQHACLFVAVFAAFSAGVRAHAAICFGVRRLGMKARAGRHARAVLPGDGHAVLARPRRRSPTSSPVHSRAICLPPRLSSPSPPPPAPPPSPLPPASPSPCAFRCAPSHAASERVQMAAMRGRCLCAPAAGQGSGSRRRVGRPAVLCCAVLCGRLAVPLHRGLPDEGLDDARGDRRRAHLRYSRGRDDCVCVCVDACVCVCAYAGARARLCVRAHACVCVVRACAPVCLPRLLRMLTILCTLRARRPRVDGQLDARSAAAAQEGGQAYHADVRYGECRHKRGANRITGTDMRAWTVERTAAHSPVSAERAAELLIDAASDLDVAQLGDELVEQVGALSAKTSVRRCACVRARVLACVRACSRARLRACTCARVWAAACVRACRFTHSHMRSMRHV